MLRQKLLEDRLLEVEGYWRTGCWRWRQGLLEDRLLELKPPKDVRKSMSGQPTRGTFLLEASLVAKMQVIHVLEDK